MTKEKQEDFPMFHGRRFSKYEVSSLGRIRNNETGCQPSGIFQVFTGKYKSVDKELSDLLVIHSKEISLAD